MKIRHSLRYRVAAVLAAFGCLISIVQAVGLYVFSHNLEERLIDDTLSAELRDFSERRARNPLSKPEMTSTIQAYVINQHTADTVPESIASLSPGRFQILLNDIPYRVAVAQNGEERLAILYNESRLLEREQSLIATLITGVIILTALSALAGFWVSGRVIAPVTDLVRRVANLHPEHTPEPLAPHYPWDEIRELAQDFDQYLARLGSFLEREQAFTSDVSHELRTPLAIIKGATEVLMADATLPPEARKRLMRIARANEEMTEITSALLILAREESSSRSTSVSCGVDEVTRDVAAKLGELFQATTLTIKLDIQSRPRIAVDKAVLAMVVGNLLRNAYSHTDQGEIILTLRESSLSVSDTGSGIDPEKLQHIFKRYYSGARSEGTGIGLSLVKRICDHYGWTIEVTSTPGQGTTTKLQFSQ